MTVIFRSRSQWNRTIARCCWPLWPVASNYLSKWMRSCVMHRTLTRWPVSQCNWLSNGVCWRMWRQKLKLSRPTTGLKRRRRHRSTRAATGSHHRPSRTGRACPKGKTRGQYVSPQNNRIMSVVAWHHGASRSIAYWTIRHEPSSFVFARCATRKDAVALAEKVYAMFPEQLWQATDADVIAAMLQPHEHTILKSPIQQRGGDCSQQGADKRFRS